MKYKELLMRIVDISYRLKLSHIGSNLVELPILYDIYSDKEPDDIVILDNAHAHLAHLIIMQQYDDCGHPDPKEMIKKFGIHCDRNAGCDASGGSLGHGAGISLGYALANRKRKVYCTLSEGSLAEGSVWEALRLKTELELDNLEYHIVYNGWSAYKSVDRDSLLAQVNAFTEVFWHDSDTSWYPEWLQGQAAHYKVLIEPEFYELMEIFCPGNLKNK